MGKISAILISFLLIVPVLLSMVNADVSQNELDKKDSRYGSIFH